MREKGAVRIGGCNVRQHQVESRKGILAPQDRPPKGETSAGRSSNNGGLAPTNSLLTRTGSRGLEGNGGRRMLHHWQAQPGRRTFVIKDAHGWMMWTRWTFCLVRNAAPADRKDHILRSHQRTDLAIKGMNRGFRPFRFLRLFGPTGSPLNL